VLSDGSDRTKLVDWLRRDLQGPFEGPDEQLRGHPAARYHVGALHPAFTKQADEETDETLDAVADESEADTSATYGGMLQSALGISFVTSSGATPQATVSFGEYERMEFEAGGAPVAPSTNSGELGAPHTAEVEAAGNDERERSRTDWKRRQVARLIDLDPPDEGVAAADGISLEWRSGETDRGRIWTVSLVNRRSAQKNEAIFQASLRVQVKDDVGFVARPSPVVIGDPDELLNALLYRSTPEYAVGHGCAAAWDEGGVVQAVWTESIPSYEVKNVLALSETKAELRMDALAQCADAEAVRLAVEPLIDEYEAWISTVESGAASVLDELRATAADNVRACREAANRMRGSLAQLAADADSVLAFRFMNRAMADQRRATVEAARYRATGSREGEGEQPSWRPFQLAFILLNLRGLADPESDDRRIVDLLWFPTGGGKTEAYLGLAAFAIGIRRLKYPSAAAAFRQGVTVLTRYTLRLLSTQQFERAAALVAACELIRRKKPETWGTAPMAIGLWVGEGGSPNTFERAVERAEEAKKLPNPNKGHPFVLRTCPWCGQPLPFPGAFELNPSDRRLRVVCSYGGCPFSAQPGLPVLVIDEQVYREPPEILLATVDKLARLPWVGEAAALFGRAAYLCDDHGFFTAAADHTGVFGKACAIVSAGESRGTDLVIQDELHLISGPLGSLVGLYEIAVEFLASRAHSPPKVVASTATIRSATDQVRALYGRADRLFPPPALNAFDTFFARPALRSETPGRLYIGLTAPGTSTKSGLIRTYASLLAGVVALYPEEVDDAYWTLVGYFNSLRELGGAVSFLQDDIPSRLGAFKRSGDYPARPDLEYEELTSRVGSQSIPDLLRRMEQPRSGAGALDVLVATNMISVGVDVDRLGLMVVAGQPKGTAEYIQATSRVGRTYPGLVVTVYNWTRPRDLSHYESFQTYHSAIYRHVEATSVTPLSPRARDRGLHAVLVAALRLADEALTGETSASAVAARRHEAIASQFVEEFSHRASVTDPAESEAAKDQLTRLLDQWVERAQTESLSYWRGNGARLIGAAQSEAQYQLANPDPKAWATLNSLRSVESEHAWFEQP
jgi:hypothetical protein